MAQGVHALNKEKFYEAMDLYVSGRIKQKEAAKIAGCSIPTFRKYACKIYGSEELPNNLWGKK
nr:MAG TPA: helix-turn-helix domain protein [Bacteriophage sp.]